MHPLQTMAEHRAASLLQDPGMNFHLVVRPDASQHVRSPSSSRG